MHRHGRAHRRVLSETDGRRLGPPRAPPHPGSASPPMTAMLCSRQGSGRPSQRCSHARPSCYRHARPHCGCQHHPALVLTVAVALVVPQIFPGDARQGGVRTNDIALLFKRCL
ncbi:hypothetical protein K438DRAFT_1866976 [Mycena galopus ATCC 62051]|nr:hypothetical protein K438DRAFT_1866976 [Mycena galopus ATCC 62051]